MTPRIGMHEEHRGRPSGRSNIDYTNLSSMVLIAGRHDLDPKRLLAAFFEASENEHSRCGSLDISCRMINQSSATFLVTEGEKVVWQFPVSLESLRNPHVKDSLTRIPMPENVKKNDASGKSVGIGELKFGMKGVNVSARIVEIPPASHVYTWSGSGAFVSNVKLADETGSIMISLWNNQIDMVHIGDKVQIKNCYVTKFANKRQLRLGKNSVMSVIT